MKRILLLMLLVCSASAWAQDVIVKRDGSAVVCRIINVSSLEIVYKKWTDLQGANLVMSINDAASVTYENGEKKVFDAPAADAVTPHVQNSVGLQTVNDDILLKMYGVTLQKKMYKKAKKLKYAGWICGGLTLAGGVTMIPLALTKSSEEFEGVVMSIGIAMATGGVAITTSACFIRAHNIKKKASQLFVQTAPLYQHDFTLKNGTSLSAGVDMLKDNTRHNPTLGVGLSYNF